MNDETKNPETAQTADSEDLHNQNPPQSTPEDAVLKLQEKPTDRFVTFINSETNKVNVLFKLKDNKNFGLCEPDV